MTAVNKAIGYQNLYGRAAPVYIYLPVQAGSTQAIKKGEICKLRSLTDYSTYPVIPATSGDDGFIPVIANEEQAAGDAARKIQFILPQEGDCFLFDTDAATTVQPGTALEISDSQTLCDGTTNPVATAFQIDDYLTSAGAGKSVTAVWAHFNRVAASGLNKFPGIGLPYPLVYSATSAVLDHADFTDGEGAAGSIDTGLDLPSGAILLGYKLVVSEAFAGDTTGTAALGDGSDPDRFNGLPDDPSVYAAATVQSMHPAAGALATADTDLTLTITGTADWGNVTAGKVAVTIYYVMTA